MTNLEKVINRFNRQKEKCSTESKRENNGQEEEPCKTREKGDENNMSRIVGRCHTTSTNNVQLEKIDLRYGVPREKIMDSQMY
jgi:hypothetical protein